MATAAAVVGSVAAAGLPAAPARAASTDTPVALPISRYSHMLLDPVRHHIFFSSGYGSSSILVTDYSGQTVATIPGEPGATGLALSGDGGTIYAALSGGDAISAISASTLAETARYDTGAGTAPRFVAYTSGKIWFGYGGFGPGGGVGSIDPNASPATVTLNATNDPAGIWYGAPILAASPNGKLAAGEIEETSVQLASYDVSPGTATAVVSPRIIEDAYGLGTMQIAPDGKDLVVASASPRYHQILQVSDLSEIGEYPASAGFPVAASISGNGTVAAGAQDSVYDGSAWDSEVSLFAPGGGSPLNTYVFGTPGSTYLASDGVAITPDGSDLFAVTSDVYQDNPALNVIADPAQGPSTLSLTGPATARKAQAITLTGTLGGTSPYAGGQALTVTRTDPADPNGVALLDVTTAADGSFTITDTPPKFNADSGIVTYRVSYDGDPYLTPSSASASVTVASDNS